MGVERKLPSGPAFGLGAARTQPPSSPALLPSYPSEMTSQASRSEAYAYPMVSIGTVLEGSSVRRPYPRLAYAQPQLTSPFLHSSTSDDDSVRRIDLL
jgi:hypothetical protein